MPHPHKDGKKKKMNLTGSRGPSKKPSKRKAPTNASNSREEPEAKRQKVEEEEFEPNDEDRAFFEEHGQFLTFLDRMDTSELSLPNKKKYKKHDVNDSDDDKLEREYEQSGRGEARTEESDEDAAPKRLPVRTEENKLVVMDVDSDAEREHEEQRRQRAQEKEERINQDAEKKRQKAQDARRRKKGWEPIDRTKTDEDQEEEEESVEEKPKAKRAPIANDDDSEDDPDTLELRLLVQRQEEITSAKERIARMAHKLLENPENNMRLLREIHELCSSEDVTIRKLAVLSELKIFHDIIPSYRILTGVDKGVTLTKEVKALRTFESSILDCYQSFLSTLEEMLKVTKKILKAKAETSPDKPNGEVNGEKESKKAKKPAFDLSGMSPQAIEAMMSMGRLAAKAMGELLTRHAHFNFRANLVLALVPFLNSTDAELNKTVFDAFVEVFAADPKGSTALECARTISQYVKKKLFKVRAPVIDVLRFLKLNKPLEENDSIFVPTHKKKKNMTKKQRKMAKEQREVDAQMRETEATERQEDRDLLQTETLKVVFLLLFRLLKSTRRSPVLPNVLEVMAHFSHLINLDLLLNLVEVLKEVIEDPNLRLESSMYTVITAFQAIKLQGDTLNVDLKDFYAYFYRLLAPATASPSTYEMLIPLLVRALQLMVTERRILSMDRVAAYAKRLLTLSLHLPVQGVLAMLLVINQILRRYPKTQQILDTEFTGMGVYNPELDDPEHCNVFASTAWEFSLLSEHVHPSVRNLAHMVMHQEPITEQNIMKLYSQFDVAKHGIVPSMTKPRPHTFTKSMEAAKKSGVDKAYYIQPSTRYPKSQFRKDLDKTRTEQSTASSSSSKLFFQHYEDVQSLMQLGGDDDDIISTDEE